MTLPGGRGKSYDIYGGTTVLETDAEGMTTILVDKNPRLIEGFDMERIRTYRSLKAKIREGKGTEQQIAVAIENFFQEPVRAKLEVKLPRRWEFLTPSTPKFLEAGERAEMVLGVRVPRALGIDGAAKLSGELQLTTNSGRRTRIPVALDVPIDSPLVEIRPVSLGTTEAEVKVTNISDQALEIRVNLLLTPNGPERTRYGQKLAPGEERSYQISYSEAKKKRSMWVGVAVERPESYVNRTYDIPAQKN